MSRKRNFYREFGNLICLPIPYRYIYWLAEMHYILMELKVILVQIINLNKYRHESYRKVQKVIVN
ncbi:hypothetical protein A6769_36725 [Nostoc punctiforme NIES-2108]|uniref:Uncharacterized protein n=1 Tax=Nostoc punctiforme NIES-2108 TaxID=1356359 RepID=A0A367S1P7_NOSPU|nr:hypothetical protein A6769_36725 [Nostoc punctiforme NIES-2108]